MRRTAASSKVSPTQGMAPPPSWLPPPSTATRNASAAPGAPPSRSEGTEETRRSADSSPPPPSPSMRPRSPGPPRARGTAGWPGRARSRRRPGWAPGRRAAGRPSGSGETGSSIIGGLGFKVQFIRLKIVSIRSFLCRHQVIPQVGYKIFLFAGERVHFSPKWRSHKDICCEWELLIS